MRQHSREHFILFVVPRHNMLEKEEEIYPPQWWRSRFKTLFLLNPGEAFHHEKKETVDESGDVHSRNSKPTIVRLTWSRRPRLV